MDNKKTLVILDPVLKKGFTSVPNIVLYAKNLSMPARCLYSILLSFAWSESECFPGQERLADVAGCTDRTIRKYLDELKEYGLISWVQRGLNQTNVYYINDLSKVESLKALGDKDRKGCSGQERKELSDKEYSVKRSVVVVDPPAGENSNSETASSTDGAAFDLPAGSEMEVCSQGEDQEDKSPQELPAWENLRVKVRDVAGADISAGFAEEILERYPPKKIASVLSELQRQLSQGIEIQKIGGWLRYALENDIQPDQPAKTKAIRAISDKSQRRQNNNRTPRARPNSGSDRHTEAEKEYIRSLYQKG